MTCSDEFIDNSHAMSILCNMVAEIHGNYISLILLVKFVLGFSERTIIICFQGLGRPVRSYWCALGDAADNGRWNP